MREIKFRGKDVDNKWRFGYLLKDKKLFYISVPRTNFGVVNYVIDDHTTIGQYTGLKDKNGVEIYEGDIITNKVFKATVEWNNNFCGFYPFCSEMSGIFADECVIIGNIYENKELLEEEGN